MALPKKADGSLDWVRVHRQSPNYWHLPPEEIEILRQSVEFDEDDFTPSKLMEDLGDFRKAFADPGARQLDMMFKDSYYKHHNDEDFGEDY